MTLRGLVERGRDHFTLDGPLHVGDLLGALVDQQHNQEYLGMIRRDRLRDVLEEHRLARTRRGDDETALALADRRHEIHHASREVIAGCFESDGRLRIEWREVLEEKLLARLIGCLEIDRLHFDQREVALAFFRWPDLP